MQIDGAFFESLNYKINKEREIGRGTYGKVYLARKNENEKLYAAKILYLKDGFDGRQQMLLLRECLILHNVHHPSILRFHGVSFQSLSDPSQFEPTIITDYMKNGSLNDIPKKGRSINPNFNSTKKYILLLGVSDAMRYLHEHNIIYRDLKPANILIDDNYYPKLCDFGLARLLPENMERLKMTEGVGTPMYMAPEMFKDYYDDNSQYDQSIDVYAFGIIACEIVTGKKPFIELGNILPYKLTNKIINEGYRPQLTDNVTEKMKTLIARCWSEKANERPSFKEIYEKLSTDFSYFREDIDEKEVQNFINNLKKENDENKSKQIKKEEDKNDDDGIEEDYDLSEEDINNDEDNEKIATFHDKNNSITYRLYEKAKTAEVIDSPNAKDNVNIPKDFYFGLNKYTVTEICDNAFSRSSIKTLSFPTNSNIKEIGDCSFEESALTKIFIPKSLNKIGKSWCKGANNLETIDIDRKNNHFSKNGVFLMNKKTSEILFVSKKFKGDLTIPDETTSIGDYSFTNNGNINSFISSASLLQRIGSYYFCKCSNLKVINIQQNGKKLTLESFCFSDATNLLSFEISCQSLEIQDRCFNNCSSLTTFKVSKSDKIEIHPKSFSGCLKLNNISFGNSNEVEVMGESFSCMDRLKTVTFGNVNIVNLHERAFNNCKNLDSISIKDSSNINIGEECFGGSSSLKRIELIADSVVFKKDFVKECTSLSVVNIQSKDKIDIYSSTFDKCPLKEVIIHSPKLKFYDLCFRDKKGFDSIEINSENLELNRCFNNCNSLKSISLKI